MTQKIQHPNLIGLSRLCTKPFCTQLTEGLKGPALHHSNCYPLHKCSRLFLFIFNPILIIHEMDLYNVFVMCNMHNIMTLYIE